MAKFCFVLALCLCLDISTCVQSGQLTAADIDDNLNYDWYLRFQTNKSLGNLLDVFVADRVLVNVIDVHGLPFSCAVVEIVNAEIDLVTGTNGIIPIFPKLDADLKGPIKLRARVPGGVCPQDCSSLTTIDGPASVSLELPSASAPPSELDLAFIIDTTGSMCDELQYLQAELVGIINNVQAQQARSIDTNLGIVLYKDQGDEYVTRITQFGDDDNALAIAALNSASCSGGGDYPEAMEEAMEAAGKMQWRSGNVARVAFVVADAPPHDKDLQRTLNAALQLRRTGVRVYALAASGVGDTAEYLMRLMAFVSGARHLWLTDDSGIGNSHQEPKVLCYQVTRLDQLLTRVLSSELSGLRVEALPSQIIREVGHQKNGICILDFQPTTTTTATTTSSTSSSSTIVDQQWQVDVVISADPVSMTVDISAGPVSMSAEGASVKWSALILFLSMAYFLVA